MHLEAQAVRFTCERGVQWEGMLLAREEAVKGAGPGDGRLFCLLGVKFKAPFRSSTWTGRGTLSGEAPEQPTS